MDNDKQNLIHAFFMPTLFGILILNIHLIAFLLKLDLVTLGIFPRHLSGLVGIVTAPLIHASFNHVLSNIFPLIIMGAAVVYFYSESSQKVFPIIYFATNTLVWLFARESYHIGASGLVYGLASFLFFSGIFRREVRSITVALLVVFLYGGLVWGVLPVDPSVSYESHFYGGAVGFLCSFIFRKKDKYKRYDWEDEEVDWNKEDLKIKYDV